MEWILILLLTPGYAGGATNIDGFATKQDCEYVAMQVVEAHNERRKKRLTREVQYVCVEARRNYDHTTKMD